MKVMKVTKRTRTPRIAGALAGMVLATLAGGTLAAAEATTPAFEGRAAATMQQEASEGYEQYQEARRALNRAEYGRAAELLEQYRRSRSDGRYVPESLYWQAFALSRMENTSGLRTALDLLRRQLAQHRAAAVSEESQALMARIHGELARRGDEESARWVYEHSAEAVRDQARERRELERDRETDRDRERTGPDETKLAALQALMNMDSEKAVPILRRVVQDRGNDPELRRQALFILSQQEGGEVADLMLDAARNDPDPEVREQALFWLARSGSDRALPILESILRNPDDERLHEQA
ncbi:MAG: HEAT repeat domain-containing protein, partial [Gemmatimonadota bacterium]